MKHLFTVRRLALALLLCALVLALPQSCFAAGTPGKHLKDGTLISLMGDSISTYHGWSDQNRINDSICHPYGEAYYGPKGGDFHNTDLLVTDTWWHQAATAMGAGILVNSSSNSSGVFAGSYKYDTNWDCWLKDMRGYLSRPYHLGVGSRKPDIIAVYLGSGDAHYLKLSAIGTMDTVNLDTLITQNSDGTFTYKDPKSTAEAYCIMLHKLQQTYPDAEIYCFTTVPSSGGGLAAINTRMPNTVAVNAIVRKAVEIYSKTGRVFLVDLYEEYGLPSVSPLSRAAAVPQLTQEQYDVFKTYYHDDPHPNAKGFDVITRRFVSTVLQNSNRSVPASEPVTSSGKENVSVESRAGLMENVETSYTKTIIDNVTSKTSEAVDYLTSSGMTVDFNGSSEWKRLGEDVEIGFEETNYSALDQETGYQAFGGSTRKVELVPPAAEIEVPLPLKKGDPSSKTVEIPFDSTPVVTDDPKSAPNDGTYDYTETTHMRGGRLTVTTTGVEFINHPPRNADVKMDFVHSSATNTRENHLYTYPGSKVDTELVNGATPNYQYVYVGSDSFSRFLGAHAYKYTPWNEAHNTVVAYDNDGLKYHVSYDVESDNGKDAFKYLKVPKIYLRDREIEASRDGNPYPIAYARWGDIQHFTLSDRTGKKLITAYCADQTTSTQDGFGYKLVNVEDAGYYDINQAPKIRTVAANGYWGTQSGPGSLAAIKDMMRESGMFTETEINMLTDGMAMTATQYSIWSYSNHQTNEVYMPIHAYFKDYDKEGGRIDKNKDTWNLLETYKDHIALIFKLSRYMMDLGDAAKPVANPNTNNTVITDKNFITDVQMRLTGKPENHLYNLDDDTTNDVYTTDIAFTLGVKPLEGNKDSLVAILQDEFGNPKATLRIAGELQPGETLAPASRSGRYIFRGVTMAEGQQGLRIVMKGTQDLKRDAYLFMSEVKDDEMSQTLVAMAEGEHALEVEMSLLFDIDAEDGIVESNHVWRRDEALPPSPSTGDDSHLLLSMLLLSLGAAALIMKKRAAVR